MARSIVARFRTRRRRTRPSMWHGARRRRRAWPRSGPHCSPSRRVASPQTSSSSAGTLSPPFKWPTASSGISAMKFPCAISSRCRPSKRSRPHSIETGALADALAISLRCLQRWKKSNSPMSELAATQAAQLDEISRRLMRLEYAKQRSFLKQLAAKGVNLAMLPIARQGRRRAPLSYAQARLWFLWRMEPAGTAYNMPAAVRLRGKLDASALQKAFDELVNRHESLRTVFRQDGAEAEQIIVDPFPINVRHVASSGPDRDEQARN